MTVAFPSCTVSVVLEPATATTRRERRQAQVFDVDEERPVSVS